MGKRYTWRGPLDVGWLMFRFKVARHHFARRFHRLWYAHVRGPLDRVAWIAWAHTGILPDGIVSRRAAIRHLPDETRIHVPPAMIERIARSSGGKGTPGKGRFFWPGDWDRHARPLEEHSRYQLMQNVWQHRDDLHASETWHRLVERMNSGRAYARIPQGVSLDSHENIEMYLRGCVELVESMRRDGFREDLETDDDEINVALDRNGRLVKTNSGRKRLAAARLAGIPTIPVRIAHVHADWWQQQESRQGESADKRLRRALAEATKSL